MNNIRFLDCTLRDGGYYTNWDFDWDLVESYVNTMEDLPLEYLEIGYRSPLLKGYFGEYFYLPNRTINRICELSSKKLAILLNTKDLKNVELKDITEPCKGKINLIRLAVDPKEIDFAIQLSQKLIDDGFEVALNLMYFSIWMKDEDTIAKLSKVPHTIKFIYLVDSYGAILPSDLEIAIPIIRKIVHQSIDLGFHGHNNLELALANSIAAANAGCAIIDSTITGMGRGAGNLKTELLFMYLMRQYNYSLNLDKLSYVVEKFENLKERFRWGTTMPYMFAGAISSPQKEVMDLLSKNNSFKSIINRLSPTSRVKKNDKTNFFHYPFRFKKALIIGGGKSVESALLHLHEFIKNNPDLVLIHLSSKYLTKFKDSNVNQIFCLHGDETIRFSDKFLDLDEERDCAIVASGVDGLGTIAPLGISTFYSIDYSLPFPVTHLNLAISASLILGIRDLFLCGFDGYINPNSAQLMLQKLNQDSFNYVSSSSEFDSLLSVTETLYTLEKSSIYSICDEEL